MILDGAFLRFLLVQHRFDLSALKSI